MKIRCYDIDWDTDGESADLPEEVILDVPDDFDPETEAADAISDANGYCVFGLCYEKLEG